MQQWFMLQLCMILLSLAACASGEPDVETVMMTTVTEKTTPVEGSKLTVKQEPPQTFWVTQLNLPVFDNRGEIIDTLRLRPSVEVFEIRDGLGRIHPAEERWVVLKDLSLTKPNPPLIDPAFTSRPPKVTLSRPEPD
ncbi:MAG: hypothetical protein AAFP97_09765 [Pseudomonadota bacterium]